MSRIEIITIGDELVEGRLTDSNSATLSERLAAEGLRVSRHVSLGDDRDEIVAALRSAAARSDAVLVSGGLGPTTDDLTATAVAEAFGLMLLRSPEALRHVTEFFSSRGRTMSPNNEKQADLPEGSKLLPNPMGTAVGFRVDAGRCRLYFMPGVPRELADIFERSVLPDLLDNLDRSPMLVATLKVFGKGESDVSQLLEGLGSDLPEEAELTVQYRATFPEIHVRLVLTGITGPGAEELLEGVAEDAGKRLSKYVFATGGAVVPTTFAERVVQNLERAGLSLAAAEGCTGGEVARLITSVADAGEVYRGSLVAPRSILRSELIEDAPDDGDGEEISDRVAQAYAVGIRERFGADLGLSTVGTAEGTDDCEAGTMVVGLASAEGSSSRRFVFPVDRERFRRLTAYVALALLRRALEHDHQ